MAIIVEDGTGKADANSYVTIQDVLDFVSGTSHKDKWLNAVTTNSTEGAVRAATRYVDAMFRYPGVKSNTTQALKFPRTGAVDEDGIAIPSNVIPKKILDATSLLAIYALDGPLLDPRPGIRSRTSGGASESYTTAHNRRDFSEIRFMLSGLARASFSGISVEIERVN